MITYLWRGRFEDTEVNGLHAEGFEHEASDENWWARLNQHSLGWVCARDDGRLVGFVNVAWDGADHAFILDTVVSKSVRRQGIGTKLVAVASDHASSHGCDWLHVDFEDHLRSFYLDQCGFHATDAGLIRLTPTAA